jgi:hypothetical protein
MERFTFGTLNPAARSHWYCRKVSKCTELHEALAEFDVRGIIQLSGSAEMARMDTSNAVKGPPIDGRIELWSGEMPSYRRPDSVKILAPLFATALEFIHALRDTTAANGTTVASYVVHYVDDSAVEIPLVVGRDIADRFQNRNAPDALTVAWRGSNEKGRTMDRDLVLFKMSWRNPKPEVKIQSIDFVSKNAGAAPFLVAITAH